MSDTTDDMEFYSGLLDEGENENTYPAEALQAAYRHGARDALDRVLEFCHQMNWLDPSDQDSWYLKGWRDAQKRIEDTRTEYEK